MTATLVIIQGQDAGREVVITETTFVGRAPDVHLVIEDTEMSGRHASFAPADGGVVVQDLGSTNGTFVNGRPVTGPQQLQPGDRIQLGATVLEVRVPAPAGQEEMAYAPGIDASARRPIPALPVLAFASGPMGGQEVPVGGPLVIGRDAGAADIVLDQDTEVSRRHASFWPAGAGLTLQDLGSSNGTYVNGYRLTQDAVALSTGDKVEIGQTAIDVRLPAQPAVAAAPAPAYTGAPGEAANDIVAEELVKDFAGHRAVAGVSLYVNPGETYGFLGPNGAGKSTTVHMLCTLLPPSYGTARIAGFDVTSQGPRVRAAIGVALQAAALDPHLNAWEHMDLQTALQGVPRRERQSRAAELIERVGLTDAADRRVGGYSGGMKRRLDLALALVHRPRVLFLDEPTTGLDPQSRTALWEEVARLGRDEGMTVFLTTQYLEEADLMADRVGIIDHGEIVAEDTPAALKEQIGRPTVEVVPFDPNQWAAVSEVLGRFGELVSSTAHGVAVRLRPGIEDLAEVIRALDAQSLRVTNVQLHAPTLDDVFLAKTGRTLEGAAEEAEEQEGDVLQQLSSAGVPGATAPVSGQ